MISLLVDTVEKRYHIALAEELKEDTYHVITFNNNEEYNWVTHISIYYIYFKYLYKKI